MDSAVMNRNKFDENTLEESDGHISNSPNNLEMQEFVEMKSGESTRTFLTTQFYSHLTNITSKLKSYVLD